MKVLFGIHTLPGHLNPMVGLVQQVAKAGAEIATFSQDGVHDRMRRAGVEVQEHVAGRTAPATAALTVAGSAARLARFNDAGWLTRYFQLIIVTPVASQLARLARIVDDFQPDVICTDPLFYAVAICAQQRRIPWISAFTTFVPWVEEAWTCAYQQALESFHPALERIAAAAGAQLPLAIGHAVSPWLNTVYTIPELVGDRSRMAAVAAGPSRSLGTRGDEIAFPWDRLRDDRPLVYVTSGTQFLFSPAFYATLIEAVRPLGVQLVIAGPEAAELPDPVHIVVGYAPSAQLIARAAMVIHHGGPATVMDCLDQGVPMLVVALGHDQSWQARFVERAGAGRAMDHEGITADRLREVIASLLHADGPERACAQRLARSSRAMDGAAFVATELARLGAAGPVG